MKPYLLRCSAAAVLATALTNTALASQDPAVTDTPAGSTTLIAPKPTVEEDLVYLKDVVALQTLRLDEAEELIANQAALIQAQMQELQALRQTVTAMGAAAPQTYAASTTKSYEVRSGDTLSAIARRNDTTVRAIAEANNLRAPYPLRVGQTLEVPGAPAPVQVAQGPTPAPGPAATPQPQQTRAAPQTGAPAQTATAKTENETQQTATAPQPSPQPTRVAANTQSAANNQGNEQDRRDNTNLPTEVGVRPEDENDRPYLALFSDIGGILTPRGTMFVEPAFDYTVASDNRFFFQGIEIVDAVLIGVIEATDTDRRALTGSLAFKYGLTNRLEIDGRIPYVSREDRISGVAINDGNTTVRDLAGSGIGDAEFGLHYQLNDGVKFPYTIANLRVKAPTGQSPFELDRDLNNGVENELAVGSGFWTIEPSLTFILSSDPASLYANIGYQYNGEISPNSVIVDTESGVMPNPMDNNFVLSDVRPTRQTLLDFDPGDAIRTSIGIGLSLNERLSLNFGYDQSFFLRSKNTFEAITRQQQLRVATSTAENPDFVSGGPAVPVVDANGQPVPVIVDQSGAVTPLEVDGNGVPIAASLGEGEFFLFGEQDVREVFSQSPATTVGSFLFGGSYAVNDRLRINLNGAIGATAEAPDARISLRAQYRLFD